MALLSEEDRQVIRTRFAGLAHDVRLLLFTQTIGGPESGPVAKQILDELAGLHERLTIEEVNFVLDKERAAAYGVERIPAIVVVRDGEDTRIRFYGAPSGFEFMTLIEAVALAGGEQSGLAPESRQLIAGLRAPVSLDVFVTPT